MSDFEKNDFKRSLTEIHAKMISTMEVFSERLFTVCYNYDFKNKFDYENLAKQLYLMKVQQFSEEQFFERKELFDLLEDLNNPTT